MRQETEDSALRTPCSALVTPVYFPFTFIPPTLLQAMSLCFQHSLLYLPAHGNCHPALQNWTDSGFLHVRSPFERDFEERPLKAALRDLSSWALFQEHADMAYLKMAGRGIAPANPEIPEIASRIKDDGSLQASDGADLAPQLFLHLAQEFDQHAWELREELHQVEDRYQALQGDFRQDQEWEGDYHRTLLGSASAGDDPGRHLTDRRMVAWNRLFQKDPCDSGLLFTSSQSALDYLLANVEEKHDLLSFDVTLTQNETDEKTTGYLSLAKDLQKLFHMVLTAPWSPEQQKNAEDTGRELTMRISETRDAFITPSDDTVSCTWYVVPGLPARILLNRSCGAETGREQDVANEIRNTLVGLVRKCETTSP